MSNPDNGDIYTERNSFDRLSFHASQGEVSPGKGFLWGINHHKTGLGMFWGDIFKKIFVKMAFLKAWHK